MYDKPALCNDESQEDLFLGIMKGILFYFGNNNWDLRKNILRLLWKIICFDFF